MSSVNEHYQNVLAAHYSWMFGLTFEEKVQEQQAILSEAIKARENKPPKQLAVDLGSGPGFQTVALAELGFSPVVAIDSSRELLDELRSHVRNLPIEIKHSDLRELPNIVQAGEAAVVVCMGDTLTHLPGKAAVSKLFEDVYRALCPGGLLVVTYRDLTAELKDADRFISVRSDDKTIMTCFLEYENSETVVVHDLVHTRAADGWQLKKSSYRKLRLAVDWVLRELAAKGFSVQFNGFAGRLSEIVAKKQ